MSSRQRSGGRRFDHDYGVTTHAVLFLTDLDPESVGDAGAHATHYEAVPVHDFRELMSLVPRDVIESSTFVDIGAGMGRGMILAAEYPFQQVTGIELSPGLYEVAKENIETARKRNLRCRDIQLHRGDARIHDYPPGNLVAFLFNPFDADALTNALGALTARRTPGQTWLIYHTPVEQHIIESNPEWQLHARTPFANIYRLQTNEGQPAQ